MKSQYPSSRVILPDLGISEGMSTEEREESQYPSSRVILPDIYRQ